MLYNLLIIVFCIVLLLLFSIYLTDKTILEISNNYKKNNKNKEDNDIPENKMSFTTKCSPCVYNSFNNCFCTNELDIIYSRGGNRN